MAGQKHPHLANSRVASAFVGVNRANEMRNKATTIFTSLENTVGLFFWSQEHTRMPRSYPGSE